MVSLVELVSGEDNLCGEKDLSKRYEIPILNEKFKTIHTHFLLFSLACYTLPKLIHT